MYWSRTGNILDLLLWLLLCGIWILGGYLISRHLFHLRFRERVFVGFGIGFLLYIVFSNIFAQIIDITLAPWVASSLILAVGGLAALRDKSKSLINKTDFSIWSQYAGFAAVFILFALINRGLAIFDDNINIPVVSILATGDVPPHFYLNPEILLDYHYGLHLFSASLVRIAGFYPWSAFDLGKTLSISLTVMFAWLWLRRYLG